jgi:hypothetical protein
MRLYAPILMIAVGVFVWRHNDPAGPNHLIFPGMDYLPGFAGDVVSRGSSPGRSWWAWARCGSPSG